MASELVKLSLPEFNLNVAGGTETGIDPTVVSQACDGLTEQVQVLKNFSMELTDRQQQIMQGWEGEAAEKLQTMFPTLIDAFDEIPTCVNSIAEWATSYASALIAIDQMGSENFGILGGNQ